MGGLPAEDAFHLCCPGWAILRILTVLFAKGLAEPVRLALAVGEIAFEDRRVGYDEVARMRAAGELPFGQVQTQQVFD